MKKSRFTEEQIIRILEEGQVGQGCQFTLREFTGVLIKQGIQISMDGKGQAFDNILVERLWRTVKYEQVYLKRYETDLEVHQGLRIYMKF